MRTYAADDFEMINRRIGQLREEAVPTCPMISTKKLHDCLRSLHRCPETCDNHGDWIGPQLMSHVHV